MGSISSHVNEEAEITSNYFVSGVGGIDNERPEGQSCTYEEIMQKEEFPRHPPQLSSPLRMTVIFAEQ